MIEYTDFIRRSMPITSFGSVRLAHFDLMSGVSYGTDSVWVEAYYKEGDVFRCLMKPGQILQAHLQEDAAITSRLLGD